MLKNFKGTEIRLLDLPRTSLTNYKKINYYIPIGISCTWKCKDCQNIHYKKFFEKCDQNHKSWMKNVKINTKTIITNYMKNSLVDSIVLSGLEPFDNFDDLKILINDFRTFFDDDIIIFSGYEDIEIDHKIEELEKYYNIYVKFGRYIPNRKKFFDKLLNVELASDNQYSKKL